MRCGSGRAAASQVPHLRRQVRHGPEGLQVSWQLVQNWRLLMSSMLLQNVCFVLCASVGSYERGAAFHLSFLLSHPHPCFPQHCMGSQPAPRSPEASTCCACASSSFPPTPLGWNRAWQLCTCANGTTQHALWVEAFAGITNAEKTSVFPQNLSCDFRL